MSKGKRQRSVLTRLSVVMQMVQCYNLCEKWHSLSRIYKYFSDSVLSFFNRSHLTHWFSDMSYRIFPKRNVLWPIKGDELVSSNPNLWPIHLFYIIPTIILHRS